MYWKAIWKRRTFHSNVWNVIFFYVYLQTFHFFNMPDVKDKIGNSIKGPITSTNEINGRSGNVATAMASDKGEFLANVVKFNATISFLLNF